MKSILHGDRQNAILVDTWILSPLMFHYSAIFLAALKEDLNKPELEAAIMETEFLKNEIISIHRNIRVWTTDK